MARFCSSCGGSVEPGQKFCMNCGAPIIEVTQQASPQSTNQGFAAPSPQAQVITNGSPLSRAWNDFRNEKGLIGRLVVLCILMCIPIVNFFAMGYCLMWCADSALGRNQGMPAKYLTGATFTLGFFSFVVSLVWSVVFGLLGAIPIIGVLASIAFLVLLPCLILSQVRLALFGSLGSAFELSKVWDVYKPNLGTTLVIAWAPQLLALVAIVVIGFIMSLFGGVSILSFAYGDGGFAAGVGAFSIVIMIIGGILIAFVETAATLIMYRAFGYFVAETAPQWVRDGLVANPQARV